MSHEKSLKGWGTFENPIHITTLQSYSKCPQKFAYSFDENVDKDGEEESFVYLIGGNAIHESISIVCRSLGFVVPAAKWDSLETLFIDQWIKQVDKRIKNGDISADNKDILDEIAGKRDEYMELFKNWYWREKDIGRLKTLYSEINFILSIPHWEKDKEPIWLAGCCDWIGEIDNEFCLMDWKSNKMKPTQFELDRNLQFSEYFLAIKRGTFFDYNKNKEPFKIDRWCDKIYWYHLRANERYKKKGKRTDGSPYEAGDYKGEEPLMATMRWDEQEEAIIKEIQIRLKAISYGLFWVEPSAMNCGTCKYTEMCTKEHCFKNKQEKGGKEHEEQKKLETEIEMIESIEEINIEDIKL